VGVTAAHAGDPMRALRLLAAVAAARTSHGTNAGPDWAQLVEAATTRARGALPSSVAEAATAEGSLLTLEQASDYALTDDWRAPPTGRASGPLTSREHEIAGLVASGLTNQQIAARLGIGVRTVVSHLRGIRLKLDLPTRAQLISWAVTNHEERDR
jgi:non-specific serine/threonine protein kinase